MGFLEKNLSTLRRRHASLAGRVEGLHVTMEIETAPARSGHPMLKVEGLSLHSTYDPVREADLQVTRFLTDEPGKGPVLVLGMGLGYHVERLLQEGAAPIVLFCRPDLAELVRETTTCAVNPPLGATDDEMSVFAGEKGAARLMKGRWLPRGAASGTNELILCAPGVHRAQFSLVRMKVIAAE